MSDFNDRERSIASAGDWRTRDAERDCEKKHERDNDEEEIEENDND